VSFRTIIASGLLVIGTYAANYALDGCEATRDNPPSIVVNYTAGDGIWIVGEDIAPGVWSTNSYWRDLPNCIWFVSPATDPQPSASPSTGPTWTQYRDTSQGAVTFRLHTGEGLTISGCQGAMAWTGD